MQEAFAIDYIYSGIWHAAFETLHAGQECPVYKNRFIENKPFRHHEDGQKCPVLWIFQQEIVLRELLLDSGMTHRDREKAREGMGCGL